MTNETLQKALMLESKIYRVDKILQSDEPLEIIGQLRGMAEFKEIIEPFLSALKPELSKLKDNLQQQFDAL